MGLLTIGAFAKASRLSPKALRLYDELGLLPPARVDPMTGYRLYSPGTAGAGPSGGVAAQARDAPGRASAG